MRREKEIVSEVRTAQRDAGSRKDGGRAEQQSVGRQQRKRREQK
jgi:hypothetical protein